MARVILLALLCLSLLPLAHAEEKKGTSKRLQQMLRKAEADKAQLSQAKAAAEAQVQEKQTEIETIERQSNAKAGRLKKDLDNVKSEKEALTAKLADAEKALADTQEKLRQTETDKRNVETVSALQKEKMGQCEGNNAKLHKYGVELLEAYERKSCGDAMRQAEPITGLKRVEIENLMEDYRDKLDEQKISAVPVSSPPSP